MKRGLRIALIALGVLVALILVGPFLVPVPELDTVPVQELAGPESRFAAVAVRGVEVDVHYQVAGEGDPAFVLLHGFASSTYTWHHVIEPLSYYGTAVALDWMPYGLTERPLPAEWGGGANPYTREAQVDLVLGLMDYLGVDRAIFVGNSAGGALAALIAYQHPERVQALILVDPAIFVPTNQENGSRHAGGLFGLLGSPIVQFLGTTPQMRRLGPLFVRNIQDWGIEFGRSAWHDPSRITDEDWDQYLLPLRADNWDKGLYEAVIASGEGIDIAQHLDALTMPVLVVTGDDDRVVPTDNSVRLAEVLPNADVAVFEACGHVPHEECPDQFLQAVESFLTGLEVRDQ